MTTPPRPSLLRRLMAWSSGKPAVDPADMGTAIGMEYSMDQDRRLAASPKAASRKNAPALTAARAGLSTGPAKPPGRRR